MNSVVMCAITILINLSPEPFNEVDGRSFNRATYVCKNHEYYKEKTPCLKTFTKVEPRLYRAICGVKK